MASPETAAGRKLIRARRGKTPQSVQTSPEVANHGQRRIVKVRRKDKAHKNQPANQERLYLRHSDLFLRHVVNGQTKTITMPNDLVVKGYTPNGKYLLAYHQCGDLSTRMWHLWREDDTLKTIYELKWYGNLLGDLLFLTNEEIIFILPTEDNRYSVIMQYALLDTDLAIQRNFGSSRGCIRIHRYSDAHPLEICTRPGSKATFAGLLGGYGSLGVVVTTGPEHDLVTTFQINPTGLVELGTAQFPTGTYSQVDLITVYSFPAAHQFMVTTTAQDHQSPSILFILHPPSMSNPTVMVSYHVINENDRAHIVVQEPQHVIVNLARQLEQLPHPTRPVVITSDISQNSEATPSSFLEELLDIERLFPVDYREQEGQVNDSDDDDDDDGDSNDGMCDTEIVHDDAEEVHYPPNAGHHDEVDVEESFTMMSLMNHAPNLSTIGNGSDPFDDNVD